MKNTALILLVSLMFSHTNDSKSNLLIDNQLSQIMWKGEKSTGSYHTGLINLSEGHITVHQDSLISGLIIIDMPSMTCNDIEEEGSNNALVNHLKGEDFFAVDNFPTATLKLLKAHKLNDTTMNNYSIIADLTILGQTHPVEFLCSINLNDSGAKADGTIAVDRAMYGIKYKSKTWYSDLGDRFINDIFYIYFSLIAFSN